MLGFIIADRYKTMVVYMLPVALLVQGWLYDGNGNQLRFRTFLVMKQAPHLP
ncbi:hypothetical protein J4727_18400 [Providencia rettgeri]|uniref:Uncharacterized protein n=1 Tax=Providencia rettgeri TaxID=587 RepID=A0A939SPK7_PRORE|nr:hypothetical protein [Providencia rettgeri]